MDSIRPLIVGNWKMFGLNSALGEAVTVAQSLAQTPAKARIGLCMPATLIERAARALAGSAVIVGGQDNHPESHGAFTGDISAEMLADAGARMVILGHSERRAGHGESNELVALKTQAALRAGLEPIICVGETLAERQAGQTLEIISSQTRASLPDVAQGRVIALAYEPVWAIGSGLTPTPEQIEEAHVALRAALVERLGDMGKRAPVLYGGSVKPANAAEILAVREVGGALVGGASLKAEDFLPIVRAAG
ncbi:MAG TPA: triose-phosphate isomerase [Caulobacteraceae bacterium]|nr:triose-phosphate isomerase [Caulobacteraceae bacterium]